MNNVIFKVLTVVFIMTFAMQLFAGHSLPPLESAKMHLSGELPIPVWSWALLVIAVILFLVDYFRNRAEHD